MVVDGKYYDGVTPESALEILSTLAADGLAADGLAADGAKES
jgi:hypothetical protein